MRKVVRGVVAVVSVFAFLTGASAGAVSARPVQTIPDESRMTVPTFGMTTKTLGDLVRAERRLGVKAGIVSTFADFTDPFPMVDAQAAAKRHGEVLVSWEPWASELGPKETASGFRLADIASGAYDGYVAEWARSAASSPAPVLVRWGAEMNGNWNPWSMGLNENPVDGAVFVAAYRRVVSVSRAAGATNIQWVWNPSVEYDTNLPYPAGSFPLAELYPGDDVVDWVALDGYNWGALHKSGWQSFSEVFNPSIAAVRRVAPGKPLMIAEIGCAPGARKAAWVTDALKRAEDASVAAVAWFEREKETDWRVSSTVASSRAARVVLARWASRSVR